MSKRVGTRVRHNKGKWKESVQKIRRTTVEARQKERNKLTAKEQLAKLDKLGLVATKERAKLLQLIDGAKA